MGLLAWLTACESHSTAPDASTTSDSGPADGGVHGTPGTFNVFDHIPQFGVYTSSNPANYAPPPGVLMWSYGTVFVTQLDAQQQALIGSDLAARVTYYAQCDNYDRIGDVFFILEPKGQTPEPGDPRIELVRFITPFSDFTEGAKATYVFPTGDLSAFANVLADATHDVWIGLGGGSNPYSSDPCVQLNVDGGPLFDQVGFLYSLDFVSTQPLTPGPSLALPAFSLPSDAGPATAISDVGLSSTPIVGTFENPGGSVTGHVTVIVSGHGSGEGGDEYENTEDTVNVGADGGAPVGSFSTEIDCAPYAADSPDGNPGIFEDNTSGNPRNWCPGAIVASHVFPVTLPPGTSSVVLGISPGQVPSGSYYQTSITFTSP
jgi:hypothetical protein